MSEIMGESCINCKNLLKRCTGYPIQPVTFTCPILNELACISKTKIIILKLDEIKSFKCCEHEFKKERDDAKK